MAERFIEVLQSRRECSSELTLDSLVVDYNFDSNKKMELMKYMTVA